jgi:hypothetical protein
MAQEFRPGEIVPQAGIYTITHDPAHAGMPHDVTVIKGRRFPSCRHCTVSASNSPTPRTMSARLLTSRRRMRRRSNRYLIEQGARGRQNQPRPAPNNDAGTAVSSHIS